MPEETPLPLYRDLPLASDVHRRRGGGYSSPPVSAADAIRLRPTSVWDALRMRVFGQDVLAGYYQQLANLNAAIKQYPAASVNYLRRGEFYLAQRQHALAAADFREAIRRARAELATARWGLVSQSVRDRAADLLSHMERL